MECISNVKKSCGKKSLSIAEQSIDVKIKLFKDRLISLAMFCCSFEAKPYYEFWNKSFDAILFQLQIGLSIEK